MRKHSRGAVTVLVTLLLIPAVLVSGTGVDIARIYAARSMTLDANQLAANAILTDYNKLLQDLYGLYAVISEDDNLTAMVDAYVRASLFGKDVSDAQLGEFRLFGGQESVSSDVSSSDPLSNVEILRRQIEEYSKYRVPVAIVSDIIERLQDSGTQEMKANNEAMVQKMAVDEQLQVVLDKFSAVTGKAAELKKAYDELEKSEYDGINGILTSIYNQMADMIQVRTEYENETDLKKKADLLDHYQAISENIASLTNGGSVGYNWVSAHVDDEGNDVPGAWGQTLSMSAYGLKPFVEESVDDLKGFMSRLDELITACKEADAAKNELQSRLNTLREQLKNGGCSSELADGMEPELQKYEKLLRYNFTELGEQWKERASSYIIDRSVGPLEEAQGYGMPSESNFISYDILNDIMNRNGFQINLHIDPNLKDVQDKLRTIVYSDVPRYKAPQDFPTFESISGTHKECCELIEELGIKTDSELSDEQKKEKAKFKTIFNSLQELWDNLTDYDPSPGASKYPGSSSWAFTTKNAGLEFDFLLGDLNFGDTEDEGILSTLKTFTGLISGKIDVLEMFSNVLANASNRVLLVGYATQMFSNWTTKNGLEAGETYLTLTGQQINASNNYFLNSEWEYLCNGSLDAKANLGKVTVTILVLRFLANYASSYMIEWVNTEIQIYEGLVSAIPFAGAALMLLVRPLMVLMESAVDVSLLRGGHAVPLIKTDDGDWHFSLMGVAENLLDDALEDAEGSASKEKGLLYTDYLTVFLLLSEPDVIAKRTGDLIALNITTVKNNIAINNPSTDVDERANAIASVKLFDLSHAYTTFAVQTKTEVRFTFLSMPFAQRGINGIVPSTTFPVNVTTYRGY